MNDKSSTPIIRKMVQFDVNQVLAMEIEVHPFPWSEQIFRDCIDVGYSCWVMMKDHEFIGFAVMSWAVDEAHILNVTIAPKMRRRGYGRMMMHHLMATARAHRMTKAYLEVRMSNDGAITLYKQLNFYLLAVRKEYYPSHGVREDALVMSVDL